MIRRILQKFSTMKNINCNGFGGIDVLSIKQSPKPVIKNEEVLIKVKATALNRADILQRQGKYPPPPGTTDILGLEAAGYLLDKNGQETKRVFTLLSGGGYAQYVSVNSNHIIDIPDDMTFTEAASIAETWVTAFQLLKKVGEVQQGDNVMIYAGASGVGTAAIQLCNELFQATPIVSVSSQEKLQFCQQLGAKLGIIYKDNDKQKEQILELTQGKGVDIILDCIGASNAALSQSILSEDSRWVLYGLMGGHKVTNFNLASLVSKRSSLITSTLRSRSDLYKTNLIRDFKFQAMPLFKTKQFKPIISKTYDINLEVEGDIEKVREAHKFMENNENKGKIVLNFI